MDKVAIVAVPDRMGALLGGKLDYGIFPQPFIGIIQNKGGQVIVSTAKESFQPVVLVFDQAYVEQQESRLDAFYEGYKKTVEYMQSSEFFDYKDALIAQGLATPETVDLYQLPLENYGLNPVDEVSYEAIKLWMLNKDLLRIDVKFRDIQTTQFID
jgi:ABC-type nitrate/sulfonate/bicarbonate transport system substrate-binding protein